MARGWHYTKLSLSSALLSLFGMCFALSFLSFCRFFFLLSLELFEDVPLIFSCPVEYVPDCQPRIYYIMLLGISIG